MESKATYDLETLIVTAFRTARDRGKADWQRMTIAVLKNRLLQLSKGQFNESLHGARHLSEILERYPTLVRLDGPVVELIEPGPVVTDGETQRVRSDLWQAVINYRSGTRYAWDPATERAREATEKDTLILPTVTEEVMTEWRSEFAKRAPDDDQVVRWCTDGLGTYALPPGLRPEWNRYVHDRVTDRLQAWFRANQVEPPTERPAQGSSSIERLRELVHICVDVMTRDELAALLIPAGVVQRAHAKGRLP